MYKSEELKLRTKRFAIRVVKLCRALPKNEECRMIVRQLMRSGTSVAANYRAVCRARSHAEFVAKIGIVVEEIDEAVFWLEFLVDIETVSEARMREVLREANELLAILAASQRTAKAARAGGK